MYKPGTIAMITTKSGKRYFAEYTLATGIDYFWNPIDKNININFIDDQEVNVEVFLQHED